MTKVAISYRRKDTGTITGRIYDRLVQRYGRPAVFMDIDNLPVGRDFRDHLNDVFSKCDVLVVIIGPDWEGRREGHSPRIHDEHDYIRLEVAVALQRNIPVIPILIDGTEMPSAAELPENVRALTWRNAAQVEFGQDFHFHMDRLLRAIDRELKGQSTWKRSRRLVPHVALIAGLMIFTWWFYPLTGIELPYEIKGAIFLVVFPLLAGIFLETANVRLAEIFSVALSAGFIFGVANHISFVHPYVEPVTLAGLFAVVLTLSFYVAFMLLGSFFARAARALFSRNRGAQASPS